jgi:hypothetical protein
MNYLSPANILKGATVFALLLSSCFIASAQNTDSKKISNLFGDIKEHSTLVKDDAQTMEAYTRSGVSWQLHAGQLMLIREHVNDLLADYGEMSRIRDEGSPWQQDAIDQLGPVLKGMADHLTATIQHQRENPTHVNMPDFVDCVHANSEYATKAASLIHDLVDYGMAKTTAESLEKELQLRSRGESE